MGASYYVAIHEADWPAAAAVNECLAGLDYPVRLQTTLISTNAPLRDTDGSLVAEYKGKLIQLEASIIRFTATESFAYGLKVENDQTVTPTGINDLAPLDLNTELRKLGPDVPSFKYGDYVMTLTFRSSVDEWKAGFLLMAGLIRCSNGFGFEFGELTYGGISFANRLVREAAEME
ncbi:hypothetical protein [Sinorhizobium sp. RAC02]|uniref:hypothetical protein n=1 Tax=Sinorhizobium sp. RAC02 TaxID=1842534 RepID=UPI00083CA89C|nr:hypothetical protein [Sinorhizobium sp. RAC02]AOF90475.1 hypothetical protein BSY16_972 [Sinorhizobium sp. RAC02]